MQNFRRFCRLSKIYEINFGIRDVLKKLTLNYVAINLAKGLTYILIIFFLSSIFVLILTGSALAAEILPTITVDGEAFNKCTQVHEDGKDRAKCDAGDINKLLSPDLQTIQDIEKVSDTQYKVTFKWKKPELLREQSGCGGEFILYTQGENTTGIGASTWNLRKYYLRIKKGDQVIDTVNFSPEEYCTADDVGVTSYTYELSLSAVPPEKGIEYTVEAFANHHMNTEINGLFTGNDLWIFSQPQSFKIIKEGGSTQVDDYAPVITGAEAVIQGSVGIARIQWKKPQVVIDKKDELQGDPGYIFRRKQKNQDFFSLEDAPFIPGSFTDVGGTVVGADNKAIDMSGLPNGECKEYEYFVKAQYKTLGSNVGLSPNGRLLKFCKKDDGTYTGEDQGATEGVSPQSTTQSVYTGKTGNFDCGCDEEESFFGLLPTFDSMMCEMLCWVFNMFINFVVLVSKWAKDLPL